MTWSHLHHQSQRKKSQKLTTRDDNRWWRRRIASSHRHELSSRHGARVGEGEGDGGFNLTEKPLYGLVGIAVGKTLTQLKMCAAHVTSMHTRRSYPSTLIWRSFEVFWWLELDFGHIVLERGVHGSWRHKATRVLMHIYTHKCVLGYCTRINELVLSNFSQVWEHNMFYGWISPLSLYGCLVC